MTDLSPVLDRPTITEEFVEGDHEKLAHIVFNPKKDGSGHSAANMVLEAGLTGTPLQALCGKTWVPQRDESKFPVCPECIREFETVTGRSWLGRR